MARRIEDVVPQHRNLASVPTEVLIATLYIRGVNIPNIYDKYYEFAAMEDAADDEIFGNDEEGQHGRPNLTVGDAALAGYTPEEKIDHDQPF